MSILMRLVVLLAILAATLAFQNKKLSTTKSSRNMARITPVIKTRFLMKSFSFSATAVNRYSKFSEETGGSNDRPMVDEPELQNLLSTLSDPTSTSSNKFHALRMIASKRFRSSKSWSPSISNQIITSIEGSIDDLDVNSLPDIVWAIGTCFTHGSNHKNHKLVVERLIRRTASLAKLMSPVGLVKSLSAFSILMRVHAGELSPQVSNSLSTIIDATLQQHSYLPLPSIATLMQSLYLIRFRWNQYSRDSQKTLLAIVEDTAHALFAEDAAVDKEIKDQFISFFIHFAGLGANRKVMNAVVERACLQFAEWTFSSLANTNIDPKDGSTVGTPVLYTPNRYLVVNFFSLHATGSINRHLVAATLQGLGKMGLNYKQFSPDLIDALTISVDKLFPTLIGRESSASLHGLGLMGYPWSILPLELRKKITNHVTDVTDSLNPQALTNVLYGLTLMHAPLPLFSQEFKTAIYARIEELFTNDAHFAQANKQSLSNIVYSFANTGFQWPDLPQPTRDALMKGVHTYSPYFIPQELSVLISSLGSLRAQYSAIGPIINEPISKAFVRLEPELNILHSICTLLSGFARMGAVWSELPLSIQEVSKRIIEAGNSPNDLSVPCIFNAFGSMSVKWTKLPYQFRSHLSSLTTGLVLKEQSFSNAVFGLGQMEATWDMLDDNLKEVVKASIESPDTLSEYYHQHVSNAVWGISKLQIPRGAMNWKHLLNSITPAVPQMSMRELSQIVYGLAGMEFSWNDLPLELVESLADSITDGKVYSSQDIANLMYSMAIAAFDVDLSTLDASPEVQAANDKEYRLAYATLIIYEFLLETYDKTKADWKVSRQQHDQYQLFLLFMNVISSPTIENMMMKYFPRGTIPVSGPSAVVPSITHAKICGHLTRSLQAISPEFNIHNEFLGCDGIFPMDISIFHGDDLIAFVEVDGSFHYRICPKTNEFTLRRIDRTKEFFYRRRFPDVPTIRVAASRAGFDVVTQSIQNVLLEEFDPRIGRWRKEWKSIILRDPNLSTMMNREDIERRRLSMQDQEDNLRGEMDYEVDPAVDDESEEEEEEATFSLSSIMNRGTTTTTSRVPPRGMDIVVRRLLPKGSAFVEKIVSYDEELQHIRETTTQNQPTAAKRTKAKTAAPVDSADSTVSDSDASSSTARKRQKTAAAAEGTEAAAKVKKSGTKTTKTTKSTAEIIAAAFASDADVVDLLDTMPKLVTKRKPAKKVETSSTSAASSSVSSDDFLSFSGSAQKKSAPMKLLLSESTLQKELQLLEAGEEEKPAKEASVVKKAAVRKTKPKKISNLDILP